MAAEKLENFRGADATRMDNTLAGGSRSNGKAIGDIIDFFKTGDSTSFTMSFFLDPTEGGWTGGMRERREEKGGGTARICN